MIKRFIPVTALAMLLVAGCGQTADEAAQQPAAMDNSANMAAETMAPADMGENNMAEPAEAVDEATKVANLTQTDEAARGAGPPKGALEKDNPGKN